METLPPLVDTANPFVSIGPVPFGNNRLSLLWKVPGASRPVMVKVPSVPVTAVIVSLVLPVVTVRVPPPGPGTPPRLAAGPVRVQSKVKVDALAGAIAAANGSSAATASTGRRNFMSQTPEVVKANQRGRPV